MEVGTFEGGRNFNHCNAGFFKVESAQVWTEEGGAE